MVSIERIYKTRAYDALEAFCDDDLGGDSSFMMCDKYDRQTVVNLIANIVRREERAKCLNTSNPEKKEGKTIFIKNDIFSLIKLAKEQKKQEEANTLISKEVKV